MLRNQNNVKQPLFIQKEVVLNHFLDKWVIFLFLYCKYFKHANMAEKLSNQIKDLESDKILVNLWKLS